MEQPNSNIGIEEAILEDADETISLFKQTCQISYGDKWDIGRRVPHKKGLINRLLRTFENYWYQGEGKNETIQFFKIEINKASKVLDNLRILLYNHNPEYGKVRIIDANIQPYITRIDKLLKYLKLTESTIINLKGGYTNEKPEIKKKLDRKIEGLSNMISDVVNTFQSTYDRLLMVNPKDVLISEDSTESRSPPE